MGEQGEVIYQQLEEAGGVGGDGSAEAPIYATTQKRQSTVAQDFYSVATKEDGQDGQSITNHKSQMQTAP